MNELSLFKTLGLSFEKTSAQINRPKRIPVQDSFKEQPVESLQRLQAHYLEDYIDLFQTQINKLLETNLQLVDENIKMKVDQSKIKSDYEILKFKESTQLNQHQNENIVLKETLNARNERIETLNSQYEIFKDQADKKIAELSEKINDEQALIVSLKGTIAQLEKEVDIQKEIALGLSTSKSVYESEIKELKTSLESKHNTELQKIKDRLENEITGLEQKNEKLKEDWEGKYFSTIKDKDEKYEAELNLLKEKNLELSNRLVDQDERVREEVKSEYAKKLLDAKEQLRSLRIEYDILSAKKGFDPIVYKNEKKEFDEVIRKKDQTINELMKTQAKIKDQYVKDFSAAKQTFSEYKNVLKLEKDKNQKLSTSLASEKEKTRKFEELQKQKLMLELEYKKQLEEKAPPKTPELSIVIDEQQSEATTTIQENIADKVNTVPSPSQALGKVFEVSNEAHWEIKDPLYKNQMLKLTEVLTLYKKFRIDDNVFVRKQGKWWKKIKEVPEFNMDLITKDENGVEKCFIERKSVRVPLQGRVNLIEGNLDFVGKMLNISSGGCLVELKEMNLYDLKEGKDMHLHITGDHSLANQNFNITIVNLDIDNKTIGLMFRDLPSSQKELIQTYVNSFIEELENAA